jgi:hypothetical protein
MALMQVGVEVLVLVRYNGVRYSYSASGIGGLPFGFANCVEIVGKKRMYSKELVGEAIEFIPSVS